MDILKAQEPSESIIQNSIVRYLTVCGAVNLTLNPKISDDNYVAVLKIAAKGKRGHVAWFYRCNVGMARPGRRENDRPIAFGVKGMADIVCRLRDGRTLYIECKSRKGRQAAVQKAFEELEVACGQDYLIARSIDDLDEYFRSLDGQKVGVAK